MMILFLTLNLCLLRYCHAEIWTVDVSTGNERFAGTDSKVYIRLLNAQDEETGEYQLTHSNSKFEPGDFPMRNLFEMGSHDRFVIKTEDIGAVVKIHIRHNNFPAFQSEWLLDQVVLKRNRDGTILKFKCNCWLRQERPFATISVLPDPRSPAKTRGSGSSSKGGHAFVAVLIVLIALLTTFLCYYNQNKHREQESAASLNETRDASHEQPSLLDGYQSQLPESSSAARSRVQLCVDTLRRWKNWRHELPSHASAQIPTRGTGTAASADQPPAYEDLYPNHGAPAQSPTLTV